MYYPYFWSALRQFNREKSVQVLVELICKQDTKLHAVTGFNQLKGPIPSILVVHFTSEIKSLRYLEHIFGE